MPEHGLANRIGFFSLSFIDFMFFSLSFINFHKEIQNPIRTQTFNILSECLRMDEQIEFGS